MLDKELLRETRDAAWQVYKKARDEAELIHEEAYQHLDNAFAAYKKASQAYDVACEEEKKK